MITYSYNNITLPALPKVSGYPYSLIISITGKNFEYVLMYETKPFRYKDSSIVFEVDSGYLVYVCNSNSSSWTDGTLEIEDSEDGAEYYMIERGSIFVWSNENITDLTTSEIVYTGTNQVEHISAATPVLTTNLSGSYYYEQGDTSKTLGVVATVVDDGILSYQWYCNDEVISGATSNIYRPATDKIGSYVYYCKVTNTYDSYTATVNSNTATIIVKEATQEVPSESMMDFRLMGWLVGWNMMKLRRYKLNIYDVIHEGDILYIRSAPAIAKDDILEVT